MDELFAGRAGAVLSADIAVPDHAREVRFYSRVLSTGARPLWRDEDLMNNLGLPIIGLGAQSPDYAHLPLQWMPHIQVADVAASAQRAVELGGSELLHGRDERGNSQWAVLRDPAGASFGIVPVVPPAPAPPIDAASSPAEPASIGYIRWLDLTVPDATALRDFYRAVVGWSVQEVEMQEGAERYADFSLLDASGRPAAGVCHARGSNGDLPPVWLIYLPVGDLNESLRRVHQEGGKVLKATQSSDGQYGYAVVQDPVGASFALLPA